VLKDDQQKGSPSNAETTSNELDVESILVGRSVLTLIQGLKN
jgi:hypothetical protein